MCRLNQVKSEFENRFEKGFQPTNPVPSCEQMDQKTTKADLKVKKYEQET